MSAERHTASTETGPGSPPPATLRELIDLVGGEFRAGAAAGSSDAATVRGLATIELATPDQLTWAVGGPEFLRLKECRAAAVIAPSAAGETPIPTILVKDVEAALRRVLARFETPQQRPAPGVHPSAIIGAGVQLGEGAAIGPCAVLSVGCVIGARTRIHAGVYLGAGVTIGDDCELWPSVYVADRTRIGRGVIIKPGAIIGSDGFGFIFREGRHQRVPQIGVVVLEDDVEVGANACVDRAKVGLTVIGRGTKIDNLAQVAHNCQIGPMCIVVAQVGLAGGVQLGTGVYLGGQVGVVDGIRIGDGGRVGAQALVTRNIEPGGEYSGAPARPHRQEMRDRVQLGRVAEMAAQVRELTQRVTELEAAMHDRKAR